MDSLRLARLGPAASAALISAAVFAVVGWQFVSYVLPHSLIDTNGDLATGFMMSLRGLDEARWWTGPQGAVGMHPGPFGLWVIALGWVGSFALGVPAGEAISVAALVFALACLVLLSAAVARTATFQQYCCRPRWEAAGVSGVRLAGGSFRARSCQSASSLVSRATAAG